jgi:uncharacterized membrane protein
VLKEVIGMDFQNGVSLVNAMLHGRVFGLDAQTGIQMGIQLVNVTFLVLLVVGFVMLVKLLSKLNKVLDIWLEQNKKD